MLTPSTLVLSNKARCLIAPTPHAAVRTPSETGGCSTYLMRYHCATLKRRSYTIEWRHIGVHCSAETTCNLCFVGSIGSGFSRTDTAKRTPDAGQRGRTPGLESQPIFLHALSGTVRRRSVRGKTRCPGLPPGNIAPLHMAAPHFNALAIEHIRRRGR